MSKQISATDAASITDVELAFSTERLLPSWSDIPEEFKQGNIYTKMVEDIFCGKMDDNLDIDIKDGFTPEMVNRVVRSHLRSFGPKHEHKIAGVGYLLSMMATLVDTRHHSN